MPLILANVLHLAFRSPQVRIQNIALDGTSCPVAATPSRALWCTAPEENPSYRSGEVPSSCTAIPWLPSGRHGSAKSP
jgi:hypothetical protein